MRSRWLASMLACTLNTKPVTFGSLGLIGCGSAGCGRGSGAQAPSARSSSGTRHRLQRRAEDHRREMAGAIGLEVERRDSRCAPARAISSDALITGSAVSVASLSSSSGSSNSASTSPGGVSTRLPTRSTMPLKSTPCPSGQTTGVTSSASVSAISSRIAMRVLALAVHLVGEGDDRDVAQPADFEQLQRLRFDALGDVDHHHRGVDGGQRAVGVLGEVRVAGRIEQVEGQPVDARRSSPRRDRDAALLLDLHPVRARRALVGRGRAPRRPAGWRPRRPAAFRSASSCRRPDAR